ncbi:hypothetical protein D3C79_821870 [compost metagenome]
MNRVGILELVDQGYRELFANQACQSLAGFAGQRMLQAQQHVIEAHFSAATLFHLEARRNPGGGVLKQACIGACQSLQLLWQVLHGVQRWVIWRLTDLPGFGHACWSQARKASPKVKFHYLLISSPGA